MTIKNAIRVLKDMKKYYNNVENIGNGLIFDLRDNEAIDKAIKILEQKEKGKMCQQIERNIQYEILEDSEKARAFAQLTISIQNFIIAMGDIDIHLDVQTKKEGD